MRTIRELPIPQDGDNAKFPDGQIRNETVTEEGTPVVREIYGDVLTNIYKILSDAGVEPNQLEDSETGGYQLLEALKVFSNNTNDLRQLLTVAGSDITAGFNFDNMPQNYVFVGLTTDALEANQAYNLISGAPGTASYVVNTTAIIAASSTVLVILQPSSLEAVIINISSALSSSAINTAFGFPLSFNSTSVMHYLNKGYVFTDLPASFDVQSTIQTNQSNLDIQVVDAIIFSERLIVFALDTVTLTYTLFSFLLSNLSALEGQITMSSISGVDNQPYMYCDGTNLYFTNSSTTDINSSVNDYDLAKFTLDTGTLQLNYVSSAALDTNFSKTTNVFINSATQLLYTFVQGTLHSYPLSGGARTEIGFFPTINGAVFKFNNDTYYSNGSVATKWAY